MAVIGNLVATLADWAKRLDPDGKVPEIVELLAQTNEIIDDALFMEGNLPTGHRTTIRTGLPAVYWRLLNKGIKTSKSTTAQIDEGLGMLEAYGEIDKDLCELNGNTAAFRLSEAQAFIEAMNQEMASKWFYGNSSVNPEQFNGLSVRYSSLTAANGQNIVDNGGTASVNTSIWLVCWGQNTVHGIFPKGSKAGLVHTDKGLVTIENTNGEMGARSEAYRDHWQWKTGVVVRDWRYTCRIANVDTTLLNSNIIESMIRASHRIFNLNMGKSVFYMNRTMLQRFDLLARTEVKSGGQLKYDVVEGKIMASFRGIPMRRVDSLLNTEAQVT